MVEIKNEKEKSQNTIVKQNKLKNPKKILENIC